MDYNICRLCLIPKRTDHLKFKNIFTTFENFNNREIKIIDAIVECAPIQIKENDNFPKDICVNCLEKLQNSYEFREICVQSDLKLKSLSVIKKQEPADNGSDLSDSHHNYDDLYDQENEKIIKEEFPFSLCSVNYNVNTESESGVGEHFLTNETEINDIKKENSFESDKNDDQNEENLLKDRKTFKCKHCTKSFHQKLNLLKHQRKHTKGGNYVCDLCFENFTTKYFLTKHKKEIHDENDSPKKSESFQCNFCKKSLFSRQSLENHLRSHTGERPFKCEFCSKGFKQKSHLLVHIKGHDEYKRSKKGPRKIFNCKHCDKTFAKAYLVNIHSRIHTGERPFTCEFCNKGFRQKIHLSRHRSIHTGEKNYACNLCSERFTTDYFLTIHKRNSHPDSQDGTGKSATNFQCSLCEKALFSRQSLENHLRSHTGERPFKCEFCSKAFKQKSHLLVHIKGHTNDKRHLCQICSAAFLRNSSLKRHMSKHNKTPSKKLELNRLLGANRNAFTCNSCGEGFISKQEHSEHMRLHAGEYAFICDTCGNGFKTSGAFKNHQLTHTGERAYHCTICTKKFAKKDQLRAHLAVHNDDLPHKCRYCPKRFKWGTVLRRHEMRHTGDRPYKCSVCNKGFIEAGALRRHLRVHTGERPYKCELCFQSFKAPSHLKTHMNVHKN